MPQGAPPPLLGCSAPPGMPFLTPGQPLPLGVPARAIPFVPHDKGAGPDFQNWLMTPEISTNYPVWKDAFICISSQPKSGNPSTGAEIINSPLPEGSEQTRAAQTTQYSGHANLCLGRSSEGTLSGATRTLSTFSMSPLQVSGSAFPGFPTF